MKKSLNTCLASLALAILMVGCAAEARETWAGSEPEVAQKSAESTPAPDRLIPPEVMNLLKSGDPAYNNPEGLLALQQRTVHTGALEYNISYEDVIEMMAARISKMEITPEQATQFVGNSGLVRACAVEKLLRDGNITWRTSDEIITFARLGRVGILEPCASDLSDARTIALRKFNSRGSNTAPS